MIRALESSGFIWVLLLLAPLLTWALTRASLAAGLAYPGIPGIPRKLFHTGIFTAALPIHLLLGFWGVVCYGTLVAGMVLLSFRKKGPAPLIRVLVRGGEEGGSREEILTPLISTALGGLLSALLVGEYAVVGYLVCGWGDAGGEVVGRRWGRVRWGFAGGRTRPDSRPSFRGSLAVFLLGFLGAWAALGLLGHPPVEALWVGGVVGAFGAMVEGLSPRGTDNLWLQLLPALLAWWVLG